MDTFIRGATIITGDGTSVIERADIVVSGSTIIDIPPGKLADAVDPAHVRVIDATGHTILPGIINAHTHGCIVGPSMPSGSVPLDKAQIGWNRNRHLIEGTTTLLNVCGLALPDEIYAGETHPLDIHVSTAHTRSNIEASLAIDGAGLSQRHLSSTIDEALAAGAKALGEVGGGQTLGGGAQEYRFIPEAFLRETGREISPQVARRLRNAVVGRFLRPEEGMSDDALQEELISCGLHDIVTVAQVRHIVVQSVMPSVDVALAGFEEIAVQSARTGYPAVFHNSAPSVERLLAVTGKYPAAKIVAGHSNHPMFLPDEAVRYACELRRRGAIIDVSTLDCPITRWRNDPANFDALVEAGCVDTISTDYAGGHWDSILSAVHRIIRKKQMSPAAAVALATGNVAKAFPQLAGDRGLIEKGKRADFVIVDSTNFSRVRHVVIKGALVVENGVPVG